MMENRQMAFALFSSHQIYQDWRFFYMNVASNYSTVVACLVKINDFHCTTSQILIIAHLDLRTKIYYHPLYKICVDELGWIELQLWKFITYFIHVMFEI